MFEKLRTSIYAESKPSASALSKTAPKFENIFEREIFKKEHETRSANDSVKLDTSGDLFVNDFAAISRYREPRSFAEVSETMENLWATDSLMTLKLSFYIRLITRQSKLVTGEKLPTQVGQGLKSEFLMRMLWLAANQPVTFRENILIILAAGSWNDIFELLRMDLSYNGIAGRVLDWNHICSLIVAGLCDPAQSDLVKKYLPTIKPASKCSTLRNQCNNFIAKRIIKSLFNKPDNDEAKYSQQAAYRRLKSSGTAHTWQQAISRKDFKNINFDLIAGRALAKLVKGDFLKNQELEQKYQEWIMSKPIAKFTGFPYELFPQNQPRESYKEITIDKQFQGLLETAKENMNTETRLITVLDTSGSMESPAIGVSVTALHVAKCMALYFSSLMEGPFTNTVLEFNRTCQIKRWVGNSYSERFYNYPCSGWCSTNLMSVAERLCELRSRYDEKDFPNGILCISDGEFNHYASNSSIFESFRSLLRSVFSPEFVDNFKIILWDIPNGFYYGKEATAPKFECLADTPNTYHMTGFDPAGLRFLTGKEVKDGAKEETPKNSLELFLAAMDQEILNQLKVS